MNIIVSVFVSPSFVPAFNGSSSCSLEGLEGNKAVVPGVVGKKR